MRKYSMSWADANEHKPDHSERTARRNSATSFDVTFQVWPNRASMAKSIRMQEKREPRTGDWRACVALGLGEGF